MLSTNGTLSRALDNVPLVLNTVCLHCPALLRQAKFSRSRLPARHGDWFPRQGPVVAPIQARPRTILALILLAHYRRFALPSTAARPSASLRPAVTAAANAAKTTAKRSRQHPTRSSFLRDRGEKRPARSYQGGEMITSLGKLAVMFRKRLKSSLL